MLRRSWCSIIVVICLCSIVGTAQARDLKISLPFIPPLVESKEKGILVDLCKAMAEEYKDGKITWDVVPFPRSLENVEMGRADFHMPYITPKNPQRIPFQYGTDVLFKAIFVLYTNKNNKAIKTHNPFAINDLNLAKRIGTDAMKMNNYGSSLIYGHPQGPTAGRRSGIFGHPSSSRVTGHRRIG